MNTSDRVCKSIIITLYCSNNGSDVETNIFPLDSLVKQLKVNYLQRYKDGVPVLSADPFVCCKSSNCTRSQRIDIILKEFRLHKNRHSLITPIKRKRQVMLAVM